MPIHELKANGSLQNPDDYLQEVMSVGKGPRTSSVIVIRPGRGIELVAPVTFRKNFPTHDELKVVVKPHLERYVAALAAIKLGHEINKKWVVNMEHVNVLFGEMICDMFIDEDAHQHNLPRNEKATEIYRNATMLGRTPVPVPADPEELPFIVGTAVLFVERVWF